MAVAYKIGRAGRTATDAAATIGVAALASIELGWSTPGNTEWCRQKVGRRRRISVAPVVHLARAGVAWEKSGLCCIIDIPRLAGRTSLARVKNEKAVSAHVETRHK